VISLPDADYDIVGSIVLYETAAVETEQAIRSFLQIPLRTHLCVIDNSPVPLQHIPHDCEKLTYYFAGQNLGYGRAHNLAIRAAEGRASYSLVMNTDTEYSPEAVCRLKQLLDERPQAGLAAPKIRYPDGALQYVCRLLPTPLNFFLRRFLPNSRWAQRADWDYELRWWDHDSIANLPYFQGSFMMLRTQLCNQLGAFDERFFLYGEDIDLTRRLHSISETLYVPDACITHQYRRFSNRGLKGTWIGIQNNCRYFNKWGWFFDIERQEINRRVTRILRETNNQHPTNPS
jgi:GT2 family glycosyltransferase